MNKYKKYRTKKVNNKFSVEKIIQFFNEIFHQKTNDDEIIEDITNLLIECKIDLLNNINNLNKQDIRKIIIKIRKEIDYKIIFDFNLDSFYKGIYSVIILPYNRERKIEKYFSAYINDLPLRIKMIRSNDLDPSIESDYEELEKIKQKLPLKLYKKQFIKEKTPLQIELLKMQEWIKETNYKLVIVFEGRDAAGKGSAIKTISEFLQPKYVKIKWFDVPTEYENNNWFYRYYKSMPKPSNITLFDRSWYNRAVNDPIMGYCTNEQYEQFLNEVVPFENKLNDDGIKVIKLWFSVSKDVQKLRFEIRKHNPLKYWKFSDNDLKTMSKWDEFTEYKERMFNKTSTRENPWIVVDSNDKRIAQLNVIKYILNQVPYTDKNNDIIGNPFSEIIIPIL